MSEKKTLVSYFSASGVTKAAAEEIARMVNGELFEIAPKVPYTVQDLDWRNKQSRSSLEMQNEASRPQTAKSPDDPLSYDVIFVGYPIWWGVAPRIINTFLEACGFAGKTIVPFATSGGSGIGKSDVLLKDSLDKSATVEAGKLVSGLSGAELSAWLKSLGY